MAQFITKEARRIDRTIETSAKKYVRYKEGAELYSMGMTKFQELTKEAHARVKIGKMVLVNREKFERYLEAMGE